MSTPPQSLPTNASLLAERYRLERRIAEGGMAEVWLATDTSLDRQVAVKVLKSSLASDPIVVERFRREIVTAARLSHPNIVGVHDSVDFDGRQAVVMQLVNGKSLRQLLDDQRKLSPELTMHIGSCVAAALDAAHSAGLVHRDVKPGNIMITPDGRVLLTDFGIAKGLSTSADLTNDNIMMGTAKYLSPEQVRGKRLDGRADLYSLGLVLYECLAGRVPFIGENDAATALARLQRDPTSLSRLRPTLPYGLAELIHQLLSRNPDDRPTTGGDLKARLTRIASGVDDPTTTLTPPAGTASPVSPMILGPTGGDRRAGEFRTPTPRHGSKRPSGSAVGARSETRTETRADTPPQGAPRTKTARQFEQRNGPSLVVIGLLVAAVVISAVLWSMIANDTDSSTSSNSLAGQPTTTVASLAPVPAQTVSLLAVRDFDPDDPDLAGENSSSAALAADGNVNTLWSTNCYSSRYFGGKVGVGLVAELSAPTEGSLAMTMANAPYQVNVYASASETMPTTMQGWGAALQDKAFDTKPGTVTVDLNGRPARFVLFLLHEAGREGDCSDNRPYQAQISEIAFTPAP